MNEHEQVLRDLQALVGYRSLPLFEAKPDEEKHDIDPTTKERLRALGYL